MDRSIDPPGAAIGVAMGVGDGEAAGDGDGEAVVEGLELGVPGVWELDVGLLPHAATKTSTTMGAKRPIRFAIAIFKGLRSSH